MEGVEMKMCSKPTEEPIPPPVLAMQHIIAVLSRQPLPPRPRRGLLANQVRILQRPDTFRLPAGGVSSGPGPGPRPRPGPGTGAAFLVHPLERARRVAQEPLAAGHGGLRAPGRHALIRGVRVDGAPRGDAEGAEGRQVGVGAPGCGRDGWEAGRGQVGGVGRQQGRQAVCPVAGTGAGPCAGSGAAGGARDGMGVVVMVVVVRWWRIWGNGLAV